MFEIACESKYSNARVGILKSAAHKLETPAFLPVATKGTVKNISPEELAEIGIGCVIANALHLYISPGLEIIKSIGGLHKFMSWHGMIFTDSGGYQIIRDLKIHVKPDGLLFKTLDGNEVLFTPEICTNFQIEIGSDALLTLDFCPQYDASYQKIKYATELTVEWARRCKKIFVRNAKKGLIFGIVQGGVYDELRNWCIQKMVALDFDGYAIGGLSIGEPQNTMYDVANKCVSALPRDKPRYMMGVGSAIQIIQLVKYGIDIFDSALPTRGGRHGEVQTFEGTYNISKRKYQKDYTPLAKDCNCYCCTNYTKAYVHHLFRANELFALRLLSIHNLYFLNDLLQKLKIALYDDKFDGFCDTIIKKLSACST